MGKGARRGDNLGEEPERCFLTARIGVRREQHASDSSTTNFKKKLKCRSETRTHGSAICYAHMRARREGCRSAKRGLTFAQNLMEKKEICR